MIKSKFGQRLRSKPLTAQINEALCKVLYHNLCVVIYSSRSEISIPTVAALHPSDAKQFKSEVYDAYRKACAYVHGSRHQIEERLERAEEGQIAGL